MSSGRDVSPLTVHHLSRGLAEIVIQPCGAGLRFCISSKLPAIRLWTSGSQKWLHIEITLEVLKNTSACIPSPEGLMSLIWGEALAQGFFKAASGIQMYN